MTSTALELAVNQQALWDNQHTLRGSEDGLEGGDIVDVPNESAVTFSNLLAPVSTIVEVGSANGRDARFWAAMGHNVHCLDFSQVALDQLAGHAKRQKLSERINPLHFDANSGSLPPEVGGNIDGFYARSALHVDDVTLMSLLGDVAERLRPRGVVLIEGKGPCDTKIARSIPLGDGLVVDPDEDGHLRRVWTPEAHGRICEAFGWTALQQETIGEEWVGTDATFLRLVAIS